MGLAKNAMVYGLAAMAANVRKGGEVFDFIWLTRSASRRIGASEISISP